MALPTLPVPFRLRRDDAIWLTALAAVLAIVLLTSLGAPEKDDIAWLLYVARKWMGGQRLYQDLVEVNPPLIVWIYAVPAAIGNWLGVAPRLVATPVFALLMLGSAWWTASLIRNDGLLRRIPVFCILAIVLLAMPGIEFGQREHLLLAAFLPFIAWFALVLAGEREAPVQAIAIGIVAGLGCSLKPTFGLVFVALEGLALLRGHRPFRLASWVAGLTGLAYVAIVLLYFPDFLQKAVPLALALYGGTDTGISLILLDGWHVMAGIVLLAVLCWTGREALARRDRLLIPLMATLIVVAAACAVAFVAEGKNWFYHRLPATAVTALALTLWVAAMAPSVTGISWRPRWRWGFGAVGRMALVVGLLGVFAVHDYTRLRPWMERAVNPDNSTEVKLEKLIRAQHAHTYIAFSEWIALGFPVVNNTGVTWASRFDSMWALHGELWRARQDGTPPKAWPIRRWVAEDFIAGCPDIAVVDLRGGINYIAVLMASDAAFAQAWSHYRQIAAFDGLRVMHRVSADCRADPVPQPHVVAID